MKKHRPLGSTCVLKINLRCCKACPMIIKKKLQKISGVNSFTIDVEKGRVEVYGEVDPSTILQEMTKLGKEPELTSFEKNKPPQHVKINYRKKNIKDNGSSDSDSDSDDHSKHVKGRSNSHVNIGPLMPNGIISPMHHQQRPHHYNMNIAPVSNGYFPAGPPPPEYQNMRMMPYAGNGHRDHHYFPPPMYERPRPPPGYGHHQPPPGNEYYKFLGHQANAPGGNSSWQFFSDDNHETYCIVM